MPHHPSQSRVFSGFLRRRALATAMVAFAGAISAGLGSTVVQADIIPGFPDGILCDETTGAVGPRVYYLVADEDDGTNRVIRYRIPRAGTNFDFLFDSTGAFVSTTAPGPTSCDNQSIQSIVAAGDSFVFGGNPVDPIPSGALLSIDASACPAGWTRQVQVRGSGTPDTGVIVCRKD